MNILVLGPPNQKTRKDKRIEPIILFLKNKGYRVFNENKIITLSFIKKNNIQFIICNGYPYKINSRIVKILKNKIINLHPAMLPQGKGVGALLFCIIKKQKLGISIHFIDEEFDTGKIIYEKIVHPCIDETFRKYYLRLLDELNNSFIKIFDSICNKSIKAKLQKNNNESSFYTRSKSEIVIEFFDSFYDIPIKELQNFSSGFAMNESFFEEIS